MQERCHTYPAFYLGTPEYKEPLDLRVHVHYRMLYCSANTLILVFVVSQLKYIQEAFYFRDPCILSHQHLVREMYSAFFSLSLFFLWNVIWCPLTCCILWKELKWIFCELACNLNYFAAFLHPGFARAISHETLNVALSFHMQYFRKGGCILRAWDISLKILLIWMDFGSSQLSRYPFWM